MADSTSDLTDFLMRMNTQDVIMAHEVLAENQYRLPPEFHPTDTIIDIGANVGAFAFACLARGCGLLFGYEPFLSNFEMCRRNLRQFDKERWNLFQLAVTGTGDPVYMRAAGNMRTAMGHVVEEGERGDFIAHSTFLDDILERYSPVKLLKIDVEGSEVQILDACTTLEGVDEIVVELHFKSEVPGPKPSLLWFRNTMERLGKVISRIEYPPGDPERSCIVWAK